MNQPVIIIGAGGHAAVVADALLSAGETVLGFTDADPARHSGQMLGLPVLGDDADALARHAPQATRLANGIGGVRGTALRERVQRRLQAQGWIFTSVRHPSAIVSRFARLGAGTQLLAGSIVQAGAHIGDGSIVNTAAVVEHDCRIGEQVHVAPRALLCGNVEVGSRSHVGAGAVIRQGVRLGDETVVGAGAVVVRDFEGAGVLVGVPARVQGAAS